MPKVLCFGKPALGLTSPLRDWLKSDPQASPSASNSDAFVNLVGAKSSSASNASLDARLLTHSVYVYDRKLINVWSLKP